MGRVRRSRVSVLRVRRGNDGAHRGSGHRAGLGPGRAADDRGRRRRCTPRVARRVEHARPGGPSAGSSTTGRARPGPTRSSWPRASTPVTRASTRRPSRRSPTRATERCRRGEAPGPRRCLHAPRGLGRADHRPARRRARGVPRSRAPVEVFTAVPQPVVHLANFALPEERGDFGSGAVELMGDRDVLVVLFEYEPESASAPLFKARGLPRTLAASRFDPTMLRRGIAGQVGYQTFFHEAGRAFCLYVVLGNAAAATPLVTLVNSVLATVRDQPAGRRVGLRQMGAWAGPFLVAALLLTAAGALKAYDPDDHRRRAAASAGSRLPRAGARRRRGRGGHRRRGDRHRRHRRRDPRGRLLRLVHRVRRHGARAPPPDRVVRVLRQGRHPAERRARRREPRRDRRRGRGGARAGRRDRRRPRGPGAAGSPVPPARRDRDVPGVPGADRAAPAERLGTARRSAA